MSDDKITQVRLKELMHYCPDTGLFWWKVARHGGANKGDVAGCKTPIGYISIRADYKIYSAHRLAWLYIHGYFPENQIDHINRIKHDNRIVNLREVSPTCNMRNIGVTKRNKTGVKGVCFDKERGKYKASIKVANKIYYLGRFIDKLDAATARWNAEVKYDFPNCNSTSSAYQYIKKHRTKQQ